MFEIGENVFCPMRGCGIVQAIETRTMLDECKEYIIIQMNSPELTMMIPTEKIDYSGFRVINDEEEVDKVLDLLANKKTEIDYSMDIKVRLKQNQAKLSSGSFLECGEVVRDLTYMEKQKALNSSEKAILMQAKRFLLDEFSTIKHISIAEAKEIIDEIMAIDD